MALLDQNIKPSIVEGTSSEYKRTQVNLIKDQGDAPSGRKSIDPRLPEKFKFHFGGQSGWVVLPKGRIVSIDPSKVRTDFEDNKDYNVITIANGGVDVTEENGDPQVADGETYVRVANKPVGVSNQNVYQSHDDVLDGNIPAFVTRNTIELPFFADKVDAEKTEWGSAYGDLKAGDKVKSDENGRFVKWTGPKELLESGTATTAIDALNQGDSLEQIVGMVVNVDKNLVPAGWMEWAMPEGEYYEPSGMIASDITEDGYPYDPAYMEGYGQSMNPTGIPGLTDGSNVIVPYADKPLGTIPENMDAGEKFYFRVFEEDTPVIEESLVVKFDGVDVTASVLDRVDSETGLVVLTLDAANATDGVTTINVTADFNAKHQYPGMPSNIDFEGVQGSIDILLQL